CGERRERWRVVGVYTCRAARRRQNAKAELSWGMIVKLPNVEKKLREARFFLSKMSESERLAFGDKEHFDFYLSAFLSAARTVDYRLRHEQGALYPPWRATWDSVLSTSDARLMKFLVDDRNVEVHESGSWGGVSKGKVPV